MAIDLVILKQEVTNDMSGLGLKQMYDAANVQAVVDALNLKRFDYMTDPRWDDAIAAIRELGELDSATYALLVQVIDPPSRAEQIFGAKSSVTSLDVLAAMGAA